MDKLETIKTAKDALVAGQDGLLETALGSVYDGGFANGGSGVVPGFTQADIDHAVSVALDQAKLDSDAALSNALSNAKMVSDQALADQKSANDQALLDQKTADDQALADLHTQSDSQLAAVNQALVDMTAKEQLEELAVADVKAKIDAVQASFDAIKAILFPPVPVSNP